MSATAASKNKTSCSSPSFQDKLAQLHSCKSLGRACPISTSASISESPQRLSPKASSLSRGLLAALSSKTRAAKPESKILVTITFLGSSGPLRSIADVSTTVEHVVETALRAYAAQGRVPVLGNNAKLFDLYCNDGEFTVLRPEQKIGDLPYRHFLLYKKTLHYEDEIEAWNLSCWCSKQTLLRI